MHWGLDTLQLMLELYKQNRLLWDNKNPKYSDRDAREAAFKLIAAQLEVANVTGNDVARKIRTMRAGFQVECRNIDAARLQGFYYNPTLTWFPMYKKAHEEMENLKLIKEEPMLDIGEGPSKPDDEENSDSGERADSGEIVEARARPRVAATYGGARAKARKAHPAQAAQGRPPQNPSPRPFRPHMGLLPPAPQAARRRRVAPMEKVVYRDVRELRELRNYRLHEEADIFDLNDCNDEFTYYGDVIAEKLRKLPAHRATVVQVQIDKLLDKELLGQLAYGSPF